jgi:hypothetical protein
MVTRRDDSVALRAPGEPWATRELVLWAALGIALSPSLVAITRLWVDEPWARPSALFFGLAIATAAREQASRDPRRDGFLLVGIGVVLGVLAAGGGLARLGRPAFAVAVVGLARALGRPSPATALLAVWAIPLPFALFVALNPGLERWLGGLTAHAATSWGLSASLGMYELEVAGQKLLLRPTDGGLPLMLYLAGIGWWGAARRGGGVHQAAVAAIRLAPFGLAAQVLALAAALALLFGGAPAAARATLDLCAWPALALALFWVAGRGDARPGAVPSRWR